MTTGRVLMGTQSTASLHQRSMANSMVETTVTCVMSSVIEMHATGSKTSAEIRRMMSRNNEMRGTMITMAPTMTSLTSSVLLKEGTFQEVSRPILET
jgi:hypothetical protein